jgi:hypothetical protein
VGSRTLVATKNDAWRRIACARRRLVDRDGGYDVPLDVVGRCARVGPAGLAILGPLHQLRLHGQPRRSFLELLVQGRLRVGRTGETLVAQVPERFLPLLPRLAHLTAQRSAGPILALSGAHHDPPFAGGSGATRGPSDVALLLPGVIGDLQRGTGLFGGVGDAADPAHTSRAEPRDILRTVEPAVGDKDGRLRPRPRRRRAAG